MLTVHHLNFSRSQRVLWLLEELGVPYEIKRYERDAKTFLAPPELEKVHPLGKSPVVTDGDLVLAESGAILEYLVEKYGDGKFAPAKDSPDYLRYRYFMHYAEGSLMPFLVMKLVFTKVRQAPVPFFIKPITKKIANQVEGTFINPNLARHVKFLDGELAKSPWFAGAELTIADIQMSYPLEALATRAGGEIPARLTEWVKRAKARPAYQRATDKGGPAQPDAL